MLGFLQGFAYGLFLSCLPWFVTGMVNPGLALPTKPPRRRHVVLRYWFAVPFVAFLLWLTSLWGGFDPTLGGWIAGLLAVAVELPLERRWRSWREARVARRRHAELEAAATRKRAELERAQREAGMAVLDPAQPPVGADDVVKALVAAKHHLLAVRRPDLAIQTDRVYTRYARVVDNLQAKFDVRELTYERWRGLVAEVSLGTVDNFASMASLVDGIAGIDPEFVSRRLAREGERLPGEERAALEQRLELVKDTEKRLNALTANNEAALTALDNAAVAVARVETGRPQASVAADLALRDLHRYIDNAERYGHRKESS